MHLWILLVAASATIVQGGYLITTPRNWNPGSVSKVCIFHVGTTGRADEYLKVTIDRLGDRFPIIDSTVITSTVMSIADGQRNGCYTVQVPKLHGFSFLTVNVTFEGRLGGKKVFAEHQFVFKREPTRTFLQTDKSLYLPGQTVRFRILTIYGPLARVSTINYNIVHVRTPKGILIRQWLNVDNSMGLVHLEFQLVEEADEGTYTIQAEMNNGGIAFAFFTVEDYVLPRFEVTLTTPKTILSTDDGGVVRICANYSFGRPVKGRAEISLRRSPPHSFSPLRPLPFHTDYMEFKKQSPIHGCQNFEFTFKELTNNASDDTVPFTVWTSASVFEEGTETEIKASRNSIGIQSTVLRFLGDSFKQALKPGLPLTVRVSVTKVTGGNAPFEPMKVCVKEQLCKILKTDSEGVLAFYVPYHAFGSNAKRSERINITSVNYPRIPSKDKHSLIRHGSRYTVTFTRYYSPTNSSLFIHAPRGKLDCRRESHQLHLDVMYSAFRQNKAAITVQIISRGEIRYHHTADYTLRNSPLPLNYEFFAPMEYPEDFVIGSLKIPINLRHTDSPEAKVLVWFTRDDGEVVSDSASVDLQQCLENQVSMTWRPNRTEPRGQSTLTITAEPNSVCSFDVVDKSVDLRSRSSFFDKRGIFNFIRRSNSFSSFRDTREYCIEQLGPIPTFPTERPLISPDIKIGDLGSLVKKPIPRPRYFYFTLHKDAIAAFDDSGLLVITDLAIESRPCFKQETVPRSRVQDRTLFGAAKGGSSDSFRSGPPGPPGSTDEDVIRTHFPETWLWDLTVIPSSGQSSGVFTVPDTVTEWVGKTVCVHPSKGVGFSEKSSIITFTSFFAELTLPASVKRGEILPVKISVFNYLDQNLPVRVILDSSPYFDILGNGDAVIPHGERSGCVTSNEQATSTIRIKLKEIGNVNLTARAFVDNSAGQQCGFQGTITKRDALTRPLKVEAEGFERERTWTKFVCAHELENNVDSLNIGSVDIPAGIVEGSARAFFTVSGDLLGPTLANVNRLVRMPFGCGEQNLVRFAPNIFVMQYLEASQQLTPEIAARLKRNMERGYERQLTYRHDDGSYGAFERTVSRDFPPPGESAKEEESGSTWLTAFVIKTYALAKQYIFIDEKDLTKSIKWLETLQSNSGCFVSKGKVFNKAMKGGVGVVTSNTPLTAYVLMAVMEAGTSPQVPAVQRGIACLMQQRQTWSTYTRAITSYALALAGHPEARTVIQELLQEAKKSLSETMWEIPAGLSRGVAVEIAGYAVLAMMTLDAAAYDSEVLKVVKWIVSQRNGLGGFYYTQDTVVALQALATYSIPIQQDGTNIAVTIGATNLQQSFQVNDLNRIVQQFVMLPTVPTAINLDMRGQGCANLQAVLRYNVPDPDPTDVFSLDVNTRTVPDDKCLTKNIRACARYLLPDQASNMAILEIDLISGYVPVKEDLQAVVDNTELFKKYEVDGNKVTFYIDELTSITLCADFNVTREVDVDNVKPGTVRAYDYYQPEFTIERRYVLPRNDDCISEPKPRP
ncbi:alpha-1-inhibitor 3-like isoform X1 [Oratosquilla oratoria]|uniref:alpha-1-inhibitor 3-like isoform X1 n=1 Tax=Oratosquilla oratoria TaxID=337810 RepID=UPI003F7676F2